MARALDAVGERWALLVVRELLLGPKRFTDLLQGLSGISQNVLSSRLRALEDNGLLVRRRLGPPARVWTYELTESGAALEPVLIALGTWGRRRRLPDRGELSIDALLLALRTTFDAESAGGLDIGVDLLLDDDRVRLTVARRRLDISREAPASADLRMQTDAGTLRALAFGGRRVHDAVDAGDLRIDGGDTGLAERLLGCFSRS